MSGGFEVDLAALVQASDGVSGVINDLQDNKVSGIGGTQADYGDDALAATVADFCGRWEIGVENLANDAKEVAARLSLSAAAYAHAERTVIAHLSGIMRSRSGTDPAVAQW